MEARDIKPINAHEVEELRKRFDAVYFKTITDVTTILLNGCGAFAVTVIAVVATKLFSTDGGRALATFLLFAVPVLFMAVTAKLQVRRFVKTDAESAQAFMNRSDSFDQLAQLVEKYEKLRLEELAAGTRTFDEEEVAHWTGLYDKIASGISQKRQFVARRVTLFARK